MHNIYIAGTGIWHPEEKVSNNEIVNSYNSFVEKFNQENKLDIENHIESLQETPLYWALQRCLVKDIENRTLLYI